MASGDTGTLTGLTDADLQTETMRNAPLSPLKQLASSDDAAPITEVEACFYSLSTSKEACNSHDICEAELATLRNASQSQFADESAKSSIRSTHVRSTRSSSSLRTLGKEQERARTDYLQAQGYTLASSRSSTNTDASMDDNVIDPVSGVKLAGQKLHFFKAQDELNISGTHNIQVPVLESTEIADGVNSSACGSSLQEAETQSTGPGHFQSAPTTSAPSRRFKMRRTFKAARALEAGNWFEGPGRGSQTLPLPRRFPIYEAVPEDLYALPPSCGNGASVLNELKFWRLPRSASLRIRNDRLPPAYIQPADRDLFEGAGVTVHKKKSDEFVKRILDSVSPLATMGATPLIPDPDEDDDAVSETLTIDARKLSEGRDQDDGNPRPSEFTADTAMNDALGNQEVLPSDPERNSKFSTNLEETNVGERPPIPMLNPNRPSRGNSAIVATDQNGRFSTRPVQADGRKLLIPILSPNRPSGNNSATTVLNQTGRYNARLEEADAGERPPIPMLSPNRPSGRNNATTTPNQNSAIWPVSEPVGPRATKEPAIEKTSVTKSKRLWWTDCLIAAMWTAATALTLFGISGISPLYQPAACTLEETQPRLSPSFSFTHSLQLTVTLPEALRPVFPIIRDQSLQDLDLIDHGLEVEVKANDGSRSQKIVGGLTVSSSFSDSGEALVCDVTYAAVVNDDKANVGRRKLRQTDESSYKSLKAVEVALAQIASRELKESVGSTQVARFFLPLWLACLLALEMILPIHFVVLKLSWAAVAHCLLCCRPKRWGKLFVANEEGSWTQVLTTFAPTCRWVLAGVMGSAIAGGILVAFWA